MSDTVETKSLTGLAGLKGGVSRSEPGAKARYSSVMTTRKGSFDGFLNTFLGRDANGKTAQSPAGRNGNARGLNESQKRSLRDSMEKTVAKSDGQASEPADDESAGEAAAAAEEAALLIWELLYGIRPADSNGALSPACLAVPGGMRGLADILNGMGALGTGGFPGADGIDLDAAQDAIDTANASAEMNSAAVLSVLDDMLDGMPRSVLADALERTAERLGISGVDSGDAFGAVAAALDVEILSVNAASGRDLLATLSGAVAGRTAAEISGQQADTTEILSLFQEFVQSGLSGNDGENIMQSFLAGDTKAADEIGNAFVAWLAETGKASRLTGLPAGGAAFVQRLIAAAGMAKTGGADNGGSTFSSLLRNLEKALHGSSDSDPDPTDSPFFQRDPADGWGSGAPAAGGSDVAGRQDGLGGAFVPQASGQTGSLPTPTASITSGMLEQMENIERLTEALRLARRNGVTNITLQMSPAELGAVTVRVQSRNGTVSAFLKVEKPEAAERLAANLGQLRENLGKLGIELGELDIRHRRHDELAADLSGGEGRGSEAESGAFASRRSGGTAGADAPEPPEETGSDNVPGPGVLNLFA